jgi:NADH-quinone oxidoreductase subunit L
MEWIVERLWLIPVLPLLAAGFSALAKQRHRSFASALAIGSMAGSLVLSLFAFGRALHRYNFGDKAPEFRNFSWLTFGSVDLKLGWMLDPLTAVMVVMVCFVGLLIFIYSTGYMAHDENFTRFFCFLSLFAAAMLGLVIANNLLLLFVCWELVGLTSYLLIGFWYHKPSAAAAAKKAFITTRVGDLALLLGMVWLYSNTGTLSFYQADAKGCLEPAAMAGLAGQTTKIGLAVSTGIALLIFCGAVGKSGQVPLHVWLPDAMEGPTPVSALIHAATMVAAGVFLVARVYPLMEASPAALKVVTWVGTITAVFAATIAVAQNDIKRILAYSTVSQLGFMMMGLGVGGVAVGMFHLITHAFFKALLFMGAGSVIHGCHDEQDIGRMGGLRKFMPVTFATYAVGMLALCGFPLFFSGFWSKDEILHSAHSWKVSHWPFYVGVCGALLTAFYMTRQVFYALFGNCRLVLGKATGSEQRTVEHAGLPVKEHPTQESPTEPHESPGSMTMPLVVLAVCSVVLGFVGTPAWPWFQSFVGKAHAEMSGFSGHLKFDFSRFNEPGVFSTMLFSTVVVFLGMGLGYWFYGRRPLDGKTEPLESLQPEVFTLFRRKYYIDEAYDWAVVGLNRWWARFCDLLDTFLWNGLVWALSFAVIGLSWANQFIDDNIVNDGFDQGCKEITKGGRGMSRLQDGRVHDYLRIIGVALVVLVLLIIWGCGGAKSETRTPSSGKKSAQLQVPRSDSGPSGLVRASDVGFRISPNP